MRSYAWLCGILDVQVPAIGCSGSRAPAAKRGQPPKSPHRSDKRPVTSSLLGEVCSITGTIPRQGQTAHGGSRLQHDDARQVHSSDKPRVWHTAAVIGRSRQALRDLPLRRWFGPTARSPPGLPYLCPPSPGAPASRMAPSVPTRTTAADATPATRPSPRRTAAGRAGPRAHGDPAPRATRADHPDDRLVPVELVRRWLILMLVARSRAVSGIARGWSLRGVGQLAGARTCPRTPHPPEVSGFFDLFLQFRRPPADGTADARPASAGRALPNHRRS